MSEAREKCCICRAEADADSSAILTLGGLGTPRYLCAECQRKFDTVTKGRDVSEISAAMEDIGRNMADNEVMDKRVLETVNEIMDKASERADLISKGEYDFSLDEGEAEEIEIPEELRETEEDRELDRIEEEKNKKEAEMFNKVTNWICIGALIGVICFVIYRIVQAWF